MIEKFNKMDNNKKIPILIGGTVVIIVLVILLSYFLNKDHDYKNMKEDKNKDYVYTVDSDRKDEFFIYIPKINIKGSTIENINKDIVSYLDDFIYEDMIRSNYEYEINGKVLSLVIKTVDYGNDDIPLVYFKTYNINLSNMQLLSDEELLSAYEVTLDDVSKSIEKKFKYWYKDLLKEEYFDEEDCDYECFLGNRDVENYTDDISYYIEKGNLVVYKPFVFYSIIGEEKYFKEEDFKFVISK